MIIITTIHYGIVVVMVTIDFLMISLFSLLIYKHFQMEHPYTRLLPLIASLLLVIPILKYTALIYEVVYLMFVAH